jgi:hypothetical protein
MILAEADLSEGRDLFAKGCLDQASKVLWRAEAELEAALEMEMSYWLRYSGSAETDI